MPHYCYNCGVQFKKKKGKCSQCGALIVQDRKLEIPKKYQSSLYFYIKRFGKRPGRVEKSVSEKINREDPSFPLYKSLDIMNEISNLLEDATDLLEEWIIYLWRKEIDQKYGLISNKLPNFCSNCGLKIEGDMKTCPTCEKTLVYKKPEVEKAIRYIQKAIDLDPINRDIKTCLDWAQRVLDEKIDPKKARLDLQNFHNHHLSVLDLYISRQEKINDNSKDDYRKVAEQTLIKLKEGKQLRANVKEMLGKLRKILEDIIKNEADYKKLLKRKNSGESVEDLITKNRDDFEKLKKERKEHSEIGRKWMRSEEGEKTIARMAMWSRMNPAIARNFRIKEELELKMVTLNDKIQKNEEEYENLLERKNKGDFVDDLVKQNRYTAESLKQSKKSCENAISEMRTVDKSDWKSRIKKANEEGKAR